MALAVLLGSAAAAHAQGSDWANDPRTLACTPGVLEKGGAVTLRLGPRHGAELGIQRGGTREWYYIVTGGPETQRFMTPKAFAAAKQVTLNENTQGYGPPEGRWTKIFTKPGRYVVHISDKLESDAGGNICTIDYRP